MQWEQLTSSEFKQAAKDTGVCIVPLGVVEKHSEHLPMGTDCYISHKISSLAAEKEAAVVYPSFFFGQINEARCFPGTITIPPLLLMELLMSVLDDIGRNGFKKIVLYNGHGGNNHLIGYLAQSSLWEQKPYELYIPMRRMTPEGQKEWQNLKESTVDGHAGEDESNLMLGLFPELVQLEKVPEKPVGMPLNRFKDLPATYNAIWWYANYPEHYAGDGSKATPEKAQKIVNFYVDYLAQFVAMVKADETIPALTQEFFGRAGKIAE